MTAAEPAALLAIWATFCPASVLMNVTVNGPPVGPVTCTLPFRSGIRFKLVRTAAAAVRSVAGRSDVLYELLRTLDRLTKQGQDTSREARLEIFERLKELAVVDQALGNSLISEHTTLEPYLKDYDPQIADAAADTLAALDHSPRPTCSRI